MQTTELEKAVIGRMLDDRDLKPTRTTVHFDKVTVSDREYTGVGFVTEFERSQELKLFDDGVSLRWGKTGARLNASSWRPDTWSTWMTGT